MASSTRDIAVGIQGSSNTMGAHWLSISEQLVIQYSGGERYAFYGFTLLDLCDLMVAAEQEHWDSKKVKGILSGHLSERLS